MGIAASSKEERRNLRREIGDKAAAAVTELRGVVDQALLQHRVLAKQMLGFDTGQAAHAEAMAHLRKQIDAHGEVLENLKTRVSALYEDRRSLSSLVLDTRDELAKRLDKLERRPWWGHRWLR